MQTLQSVFNHNFSEFIAKLAEGDIGSSQITDQQQITSHRGDTSEQGVATVNSQQP